MGQKWIINAAAGSQVLFGTTVCPLNICLYNWYSTGQNTGTILTQTMKYWMVQLDTYTTRLYIEDYPNILYSHARPCRLATSPQQGCSEPDFNDLVIDVTNTPEPATVALMATGLAGVIGASAIRRRRRKND